MNNLRPRIYFHRGYWRVRVMPRHLVRLPDYVKLWVAANTFACNLNIRLHSQLP